MKSIYKRSLTGSIYVTVMVGGMLAPANIFIILLSILHIGLWKEYYTLLKLTYRTEYPISNFYKFLVLIIGEAILFWVAYDKVVIGDLPLRALSVWIFLIGIFNLLIYVLIIQRLDRKTIVLSLIGILWISLPLSLILDLKTNCQLAIFRDGIVAPLSFFSCIWLNDTFAYLVGSWIGRTKLSSFSPKKSWEGTIGGIIASTIFCAWLFNELGWVKTPHHIILPILIGVFGTIGDLLESALKRKTKVKDSGVLLPGHGGLLDRLDSALIAIIAVHIYMYLVQLF